MTLHYVLLFFSFSVLIIFPIDLLSAKFAMRKGLEGCKVVPLPSLPAPIVAPSTRSGCTVPQNLQSGSVSSDTGIVQVGGTIPQSDPPVPAVGHRRPKSWAGIPSRQIVPESAAAPVAYNFLVVDDVLSNRKLSWLILFRC